MKINPTLKSALITLWMMATGLTAVSQQLLNPITQPKFVNQLPRPAVMQPDTPGGMYYTVPATQFQQDLGLKAANGSSLLTTVWGYKGSYPAPTIEARKNQPVIVNWENKLLDNNGLPLPHLLPVDTTVHWAKPTNWPMCGVPIVPHLHGGHVTSENDGNPEAWYTPDSAQKGPVFSDYLYYYPNNQEASTIWYHDHALGITRLNVYAGLAGFYLIRDNWEDQLNLPSGNYEIPIVIQDRMFTSDGQLYYPSQPEEAGQPNPSVLPEFFGDFILVNGKTWPVLDVEPRKYRFRFLNGSDSRFYVLYFSDSIPFIQIGSDGGLFNSPVRRSQMIIAPGEREDVIIDFSNPAYWNRTFILKNNGRSPFPNGTQPQNATTGQIMAFRVSIPLSAPDNSVIPSTLRQSPVQLYGAHANNRQLLLLEMEDEYDRLLPSLGTADLGPLMWHDPITENPGLNVIEQWEIINMTMDAHPIHLHQQFFQVVSRQRFNMRKYRMGVPSSLQLVGNPIAPLPEERGWKDTQISYPGEVLRIKVKFDIPGLFLWHCHILSHEDHEMMRPIYVGNMPSAMRATKSLAGNLIAYPNPVSETTTIRFTMNRDEIAAVRVFDTMGKLITTLHEGTVAEGLNEFTWNVREQGVMSGIYFVVLQTSDRTEKVAVTIQ